MARDNEEMQLAAADARTDQLVEAAKDLLVEMIQSRPNGQSVARLVEILDNPDKPEFARLWRDPSVQRIVSSFARVGLQLTAGRVLGRTV